MIINGVELEDLDIYDVEFLEKYEKVLKDMDIVKEEVQGMSNVDAIKKICTTVFEIFNTMFGEGTDKKVFGDKVNLRLCLKTFEEFVLKMEEQKKEMNKLMNKYSPNRAQRRAKK